MIVCENLSLGYGARVIVRNLSFTLNDGDYLCVIGENGSGKSTLLKAMLGLIAPLSGSIRGAEGAGYLPQQSEAQKDFPASVGEVVMSGFVGRLGWRAFYTREEKLKAREAMRLMNILELKARCFSELSGGQRQRVLLARALCAARNVLVLDEPVAGLDPEAASDMYRVIHELNNTGLTVIMVTHDVETALKFANRTLNLNNYD